MKEPTECVVDRITSDEIAEIENIELLFFAYRDFVSDPDMILAQYDFGRAHHRVLYFVNRTPGMTVAELLDILQITKQSLGRVLKQLIETRHITQTIDHDDKRKRLLFPTRQGRELILKLSTPQSLRIQQAMKGMDGETREAVITFLRGMISQGS